MTIEERIANAEKTVADQRKKLSGLIKEYGVAVTTGDTHALVTVKDLFLGFLFHSRYIEVRLLGLSREATTHRKTIERAEYLHLKRDKEAGKTDQMCKYKAEAAAMVNAAHEHITEMFYREMKAINDSAEDYLAQIIQRISVAKKEEFNSKLSTT